MARKVDQDHREMLVNAVAASFVADGTARASLRDLAVGVGASARMLVHHFGTREKLVNAALDVARARQLAAAHEAIVPGPDALAVLDAVWVWFLRADTCQYFALFTDIAARERTQPAHKRRFTARLGTDWRPLFESVFQADVRFTRDASALALIVIGVLRGFALDLHDGGDAGGHQQAFAALVDLIAARGGQQ
jgi:AcrR family transcriptional regulator